MAGVPIAAPQQWLRVLSQVGADDVRIRNQSSVGRPEIRVEGARRNPRYLVEGVITTDNELVLPGPPPGTKRFRVSARGQLRAYVQRLRRDGPDAVMGRKLRFGLTEKQIEQVYDDLSRRVTVSTVSATPAALVNQLRSQLSLSITVTPAATRILASAKPVANELRGLTLGTSLAAVFRSCGLGLKPRKSANGPVQHRVVRLDKDVKVWPIGWSTKKQLRLIAPVLLKPVNAEIDGIPLADAIDAIGQRIKIPVLVDHLALDRKKIDPLQTKVRLPPRRMLYIQLLRGLSPKLRAEVRIDEADTPFMWLTTVGK